MMTFTVGRALGHAALVLTLACNHGTRPWRFAPALGPEGARVAIRVSGERDDRVGELIALDSAGVVILAERLVRVPWAKLDAMDVAQVGNDYDVQFGEKVTSTKRQRLALLSRFPQGLSAALLARVLSQLHQ